MGAPNLSTYGGNLLDKGYQGQVADLSEATIVSKRNESATAIDFGIAVARGASDDTCKVIAADVDLPFGISARAPTMPATSGVINYAQHATVPVMREGFIWVIPFENVTRGDQVLSITAQGGKLGGTTGGAAGAGRVVVPNAVWETSVTADGSAVGLIRISG